MEIRIHETYFQDESPPPSACETKDDLSKMPAKVSKNLVKLQFPLGTRRPNQSYQEVVPGIQHPHQGQAFP